MIGEYFFEKQIKSVRYYYLCYSFAYTVNYFSSCVFDKTMNNLLLRLLERFFSSNKYFGSVRTKHETSAPLEWKESFWDKLKKDKLFSPIDLHSKEHFKEIRIKIGKKFIILAINIFLISFSFNIIKDTYNIIKADYSLINASKKDFTTELPNELILDEQNKINKLELYVKRKDILNIAKTTNELSIYAKWKDIFVKKEKEKYIEENKNAIKGNLFSFLNNLFVLFLILKKKITRQQ